MSWLRDIFTKRRTPETLQPQPGGQKFDIRDYNSFTPIQREMLADLLKSRDIYTKIWVANTCIRKIADAAGLIWSSVSLQDSKGEIREDNPVYKLFKYPFPTMSGVELMEFSITQYILNGNCYEYVTGTQKKPLEVWPLFARNITPIGGDPLKGEPVIKVYRDDTQKKDYSPDSVIHAKTVNPESLICGISLLSAGETKLEQLDNIENFNNKIFKNGAFPSINFSTEQDLIESQRNDLKKSIQEQYAGVSNAGKVMLTWGGVKAIPMAFSPSDMQVLNNENMTAGAIASLLGVPPELLGNISTSKTYSNYREAKSDFINSTVIPHSNRIIEKRNHFFFPSGDFKFVLNENRIDYLKPSSAELNESWWLTPNQKRQLQGYQPIGDPAMDLIYIPSGYQTIEQAGFAGSTMEL